MTKRSEVDRGVYPEHLRFTVGEHEGFVHVIFTTDVTRRGFTHFAHAQWQSAPNPPEVSARASRIGGGSSEYVVDLDNGGLGLLIVNMGWVQGTAAGASPDAARAALDELRLLRPARGEREETVVPVTFWSASAHGPMPIQRELEVPTWTDIEANYSAATRAGLSRLMNPMFRAGHGGQLVLWHGETGTGKTTALRALAYQWRDWCGVHYITDPEKFFGDHTDYMLTVIVQQQELDVDEEFAAETGLENATFGVGPFHAAAHYGAPIGRVPPWRLLVLEDAGELLAADARAVTGQALSRFLNAVDGLIGQGLRFLVLVTTNEELGKLHPAVARAGRAAARVEFARLTAEEASTWLEERGAEDADAGESARTLASLYAQLEGMTEIPVSRPLGF